jgi:hypothetical protein
VYFSPENEHKTLAFGKKIGLFTDCESIGVLLWLAGWLAICCWLIVLCMG